MSLLDFLLPNRDVHRKLDELLERTAKMSADFDRLIAEVTETRTAQAGLIALVTSIAEQLRENAGNAEKVRELADSLDAGQSEIAAAIAANTPEAEEPDGEDTTEGA